MDDKKPALSVGEVENLLKFKQRMTDNFKANASSAIIDVVSCLKDIVGFHDKSLSPLPTDANHILMASISFITEFSELSNRVHRLNEIIRDGQSLLIQEDEDAK